MDEAERGLLVESPLVKSRSNRDDKQLWMEVYLLELLLA